MSITSTQVDTSATPVTYPILKESSDYVVLFTAAGQGFVVEVKSTTAVNSVGFAPSFWQEDMFTVSTRSVVLSNT